MCIKRKRIESRTWVRQLLIFTILPEAILR